jgi:glutaminyl-tRNA synthetase
MPTIAGLRRRGYTSASIREFADRIGVTKSENSIEMGVLEACIREDLGDNAPRRLAVLNPLKVVIENYPEGSSEELVAANHPKDEEMGQRTINLSRVIYIDKADFRETANKKFKRLITEGEVRLRNAYVIKCETVIKDEQGEIIELRCSYDKDTLGANPVGRKVRGVIHWVSAQHAVDAEIRLYDRLFSQASPDADKEVDFLDTVNPDSLVVVPNAKVELSLKQAKQGERYQFEREGYYCVETEHNESNKLVFNRIVTLRDSWAKIEQATQQKKQ